MGKTIKAKSDLGINSIMDPVMIPDGFARVCDGLELRSGVARTWQLPVVHRPLGSLGTKCIWEFRGIWFESPLFRTYHGEYLYGQQIVYFTEEGYHHLPPQKVIDGIQARLGIQRPLAPPIVSEYDARFPASVTAALDGAGGLATPYVSYRVASTKGGKVLAPGDSVLVTLPQVAGVVTPSSVLINWRKVNGADGYAVFGRTSGAERLLVMLGDTSQWIDNGSVGEQASTAASFDVSRSFQYVYTYYRKIATVEDESGPSPLSALSSPGITPIITRLPLYDGLYSQPGTVTYKMSTNSVTLTIPSAYIHNLYYSMVNASNTVTMYVSQDVHGMITGDLGRVTVSPAGTIGIDYPVTVPFPLQPPTVTLDITTPYPAGGAVAVGPHTYTFTAVRGTIDFVHTNPAQTLATTVVVTVPGAGNQSVRFDIGSFTPGTDSILVYRDNVPIAFIPMNGSLAVATWTDDGTVWHISLVGCSVPSGNETATRCFSVAANIPLPPWGGLNPPGIFQQSLVDIVLGGTPVPPFVPSPAIVGGLVVGPGDALLFSGLVALGVLNGASIVRLYNPGTHTATIQTYADYVTYNGVVDTSAGTMKWLPANAYYSGWRIYRVGDTAQFLLVADLPLSQTSFIDLVSTDQLGIAIPTAYTENGLQVVFDWAPEALKRMVNHYNIRFGIVDGVVRWTPTGIPDAWPDVFFAALPTRPVALASFKTMLMVLCEEGLYGLAGNTPSTISVHGPFSNLGCIAPFSVQSSNYGIMWLSKVGVCISQDGVSARCLTADRVPGRYFYAPSEGVMVDGINVGGQWWMPATQSVQFAESMSQEKIDHTLFPVTEVTADLPINAELEDLRSFYWNDRYGLYATGASQHARTGTMTIDMSSSGLSSSFTGGHLSAGGMTVSAGLPVTTIPIKPVDVHVSHGGDCYMLLVTDAS